ncbi:MAG: hypothetical protein OCD02_10640 [Spirochaetaceae bacterium]
MISHFVRLLILLSLISFSISIYCREDKGVILNVTGDAELFDSQIGGYAKAEIGNLLYLDSLIITGRETWVDIMIGDSFYSISPLRFSDISTFLTDRRITSIEHLNMFFKSIDKIINLVGDNKLTNNQEISLYKQALIELNNREYQQVINIFAKIDDPDYSDFDVEDYYIYYTYCLMVMEDFQGALYKAFMFLHYSEPDSSVVHLLPKELQYLSAVCAFYLEQDELAVNLLEAFFKNKNMENANLVALSIYNAINN